MSLDNRIEEYEVVHSNPDIQIEKHKKVVEMWEPGGGIV
jgi:hypothetical protein